MLRFAAAATWDRSASSAPSTCCSSAADGAIRRAGTGPSNSRASTVCGSRSKPCQSAAVSVGKQAASSRSSGECSAASCRTIERATASTSARSPITATCPAPSRAVVTGSSEHHRVVPGDRLGLGQHDRVVRRDRVLLRRHGHREPGQVADTDPDPKEVGVGAPSLPQPTRIADELQQRCRLGVEVVRLLPSAAGPLPHAGPERLEVVQVQLALGAPGAGGRCRAG